MKAKLEIELYNNGAEVELSKDCSGMCKGSTSIIKFDFGNSNTENVTNMKEMFYGCTGLQELNLSNFDTSKVTNMRGMFYWCKSLTSLNLSSFYTQNVTTMVNMFQNCTELRTLDLSNWSIYKIWYERQMFGGLKNLEKIYREKGVPLKTEDEQYKSDLRQCVGNDQLEIIEKDVDDNKNVEKNESSSEQKHEEILKKSKKKLEHITKVRKRGAPVVKLPELKEAKFTNRFVKTRKLPTEKFKSSYISKEYQPAPAKVPEQKESWFTREFIVTNKPKQVPNKKLNAEDITKKRKQSAEPEQDDVNKLGDKEGKLHITHKKSEIKEINNKDIAAEKKSIHD